MCVCVCCAFLFDLGLVAGSYLIPLGCWFHLSFLAAFVTIRCAKQEQLEKKGQPMSPILLNSVLEHIVGSLQAAWRQKGFGMDLGNSQGNLTNLRFADDLLLIATSRRQMKHMLEDLIVEAARAGLEIHPVKTKIMTNEDVNGGSMAASGHKVEILPPDKGTDYLGRRLCCGSIHDTEIDARIGKAWRIFSR